jgi:hypothetical protein
MRTATRPGWNWKRSTRWFAAEFLVVATGVLVALALNAWWQGREDVARERAYLQQLSVDLQTNEQMARTTLEYMDERVQLGSRLLDAIRTRPLPPPDSLDHWLDGFLGVAPLYPWMGTVQALIETGDLNLIRNDALRTGIIDYVGHVQLGSEMTASIDQLALRSLGDIHQRVDVEGLREAATAHSRADWDRLADDPIMRGSVSALLVGHSARRRSADGILNATIALREQVELARR